MSVETKFCKRCETKKSIDDFGVDNSRKDGRNIYCLSCRKATGRVACAAWRSKNPEWFKERYAANPEAPEARKGRWYGRYGLTLESYSKLLEEQGGVCALCGTEPKSERAHGRNLAIDHDHSCCPEDRQSCGNCIRGLICASCNTVLGGAMDDPALLSKMADYVLRGGVIDRPETLNTKLPTALAAGKVIHDYHSP